MEHINKEEATVAVSVIVPCANVQLHQRSALPYIKGSKPITLMSRAVRSLFTLNRDREYHALKQMLDLKENNILLDAGCGDGFWTYRIAKACRHVVGIDPAAKSVEYAQRLHTRPNISYVCSVGESLPFDDCTFDKVISISCLEHFADPRLGLSEMARVLKPGGRIALSVDSLLPENSPESFRDWHKRRHFVTQYFSEDTLAKMLRSAGLQNDSAPAIHLFSSRIAARLREIFIRRPRLWLLLFPAFYLAVRVADRIFKGRHGQIIVVSASR
jgi:SAM-dependent methyltransferase